VTLVENFPRSIRVDRTRRARAAGVIIGASVLLVLAIVVSATTGALPISLGATWAALEKGALGRTSLLVGPEIIAWNLRFPRVVMAVLVGACLGTSGAAMQGLFRNPLADPYLLGIAGGASFGATLAFSANGDLGPAFGDAPFLEGRFSGAVPLWASIGAAGAVALTLLFARTGARGRSSSLLLAGVVVGAVLVSLTTYLMLKDADRLRAVVSWSLGNLASSRWQGVAHAAPYAISGLLVLFALARGLDALQLGEETARTIGVPVPALRLGVIVGASLATAAAVAFVGVIGFVGLVAPHVMRRIGVPGHRALLPASALGGATLLVVADLGARTLVRPAELPVGILTTFFGGPFFLWLLRRAP
jgi:iron complex transport system permease protein